MENIMKKIVFIIFILLPFSLHSQDYEEYAAEYTDSAENIPEEPPVNIVEEIVEITNYITNYVTNKIFPPSGNTRVEVTNTTIIHIPSLVPLSIDVSAAIIKGRLGDVELFIGRNPNLLLQTDENGNNLLHLSVLYPNADIISYLIGQGININHMNNNGQTPLHLAAAKTNLAAVQILVESNAAVSIKDNLGQTPLWIANIKGLTDILKILAAGQMAQAAQQTVISNLQPYKDLSKELSYDFFNKKYEKIKNILSINLLLLLIKHI